MTRQFRMGDFHLRHLRILSVSSSTLITYLSVFPLKHHKIIPFQLHLIIVDCLCELLYIIIRLYVFINYKHVTNLSVMYVCPTFMCRIFRL